MAALFQRIGRDLAEWWRLHGGYQLWDGDLERYRGKLETAGYHAWTIDSAIGFEGFVIAKAVAQRAPNPQGGANGRQPFSSDTSQTSAAAASRRSPDRFAKVKNCICIILGVTGFVCPVDAGDESMKVDELVVKALKASLPHEAGKREEFLWRCSNESERRRFNPYTIKNWKAHFDRFATTLVTKAHEQNLDSVSLRKAFHLVLKDSENHKLAYLPTGAYETTLDGEPVWIITVKWEGLGAGEEAQLAHIRVFAFEEKTLQRVGFETCN
jgi:hypothetical protein